ncbi:MAG: crossover junction endodeoxyribonuclease RuvC [Caldicoprobacterales bacterium]|nr:crossover junction endodeoxyribonuclease RuvC [Clostridiales bacterium]
MIIMGIDPGLATMGYGIIESRGNKIKALDYGVVTTPADMEFSRRLLHIFNSVEKLIQDYSPQAVVYEELFFNKNVKTALIIGHARGAAVLAGARQSIDLFEYTPLQVKQAVVGYGRADKNQVQSMVKLLLGLREIPKPDDAADALAVAICHLHSHQYGRKLGVSGQDPEVCTK